MFVKYFAWKNYLAELTGGNPGGDYLEGNYQGVIIWGTVIQTPIVGEYFWLEAIVWGQFSWGQLSRRQLSGG